MIRILSKSISSRPVTSTDGKSLPVICNLLNRKYTTGDDADVVVTKKDHLLTIRLNRPKKVCLVHFLFATLIFKQYNAVTQPMYNKITEALNEGGKDNDVTMAILTGTGKFYSAGNDLAAMASMAGSDHKAAAETGRKSLHAFQCAFIDFPKPLVAAVNGPAIGIMVTTLALADIVWASDTASFSAPFSGTAQTPEGCASLLFPQILGPSLANEMIMLNRKLSVTEALQAGFVSTVLPTDKFHETVENNLRQVLKSSSGPAMIASKRLLRSPELQKKLQEVSLTESHALVDRWLSPDFPEFIMKFLSRKG